MIDQKQAHQLAQEYVTQIDSRTLIRSFDRFALLDGETLEEDFGWVYFYTNQRYLISQSPKLRVYGNAPFIVDRCDGSIHVTGTARSTQSYVDEYKRDRDQTRCLVRDTHSGLSFLHGGKVGKYVLFLHGIPGSSLSWAWIAQALSSRAKCEFTSDSAARVSHAAENQNQRQGSLAG